MSDPTELEVTLEDIQLADRGAEYNCPIARAGMRVFGVACQNAGEWGAQGWALTVYDEFYHVIGGEDFAMAFDEGKTVKPHTFTITKANP